MSIKRSRMALNNYSARSIKSHSGLQERIRSMKHKNHLRIDIPVKDTGDTSLEDWLALLYPEHASQLYRQAKDNENQDDDDNEDEDGDFDDDEDNDNDDDDDDDDDENGNGGKDSMQEQGSSSDTTCRQEEDDIGGGGGDDGMKGDPMEIRDDDETRRNGRQGSSGTSRHEGDVGFGNPTASTNQGKAMRKREHGHERERQRERQRDPNRSGQLDEYPGGPIFTTRISEDKPPENSLTHHHNVYSYGVELFNAEESALAPAGDHHRGYDDDSLSINSILGLELIIQQLKEISMIVLGEMDGKGDHKKSAARTPGKSISRYDEDLMTNKSGDQVRVEEKGASGERLLQEYETLECKIRLLDHLQQRRRDLLMEKVELKHALKNVLG